MLNESVLAPKKRQGLENREGKSGIMIMKTEYACMWVGKLAVFFWGVGVGMGSVAGEKRTA